MNIDKIRKKSISKKYFRSLSGEKDPEFTRGDHVKNVCKLLVKISFALIATTMMMISSFVSIIFSLFDLRLIDTL